MSSSQDADMDSRSVNRFYRCVVDNIPYLKHGFASLVLAVGMLAGPVYAQTAEDYGKSAAEKLQKLKIGDAIEDLTRAIKLEPNNPKWWLKRGEYKSITITVFAPLTGDKDDDGAIADFTEGIRLDPKSISGYLGRARIKESLGNPAGAIADYDQVIRIEPDAPVGYSARAWVKLGGKDSDGALADFDRALTAPEAEADSRGWNLYGRATAWRAKGDLSRALTDLDQAISLSQNRKDGLPLMYRDRLEIRTMKGDTDGALSDLDSYILLKPNEGEMVLKRGQLKRYRGDTKGALADFDRAIVLDDDYGESNFERGIIRLSEGKWDSAVDDFEQYLDSTPSPDDYVAFYLYIADRRLGLANASTELAKFKEDWPDGSWLRAIASYLQGLSSETDLLAKATEGQQESRKARLTDAHYYIGIGKLLAGKTGEAKTSFEACVAQGSGLAYHEHFLAQVELARLAVR